ncbi:MAG: gas vesicle protein [Oscillochloridaceae bacterium]|nr:gas vesicle protein [Chloroflexaceae bacterium]MDW8388690.1 gas vesicle protein [Oscillochloridaceae bacterium]
MPGNLNVATIVNVAREQIAALTGMPVDTVSRVLRDGNGWMLDLELLEMKRIPDSNDVLATYQVHLDTEGNLMSFLRTNRYYRGQVKQ